MPEEERRTIEELVTRYEFEPGLRDIYVEGPEDKWLLEGLLHENDVTGVSVFEICTVDIPAEPGQESSSRTRVVKLARLLREALDGEQLKVACVVDSDFDHLTGQRECNALLLSTDYANMEMYFFATDILRRLSVRCLRGRQLTARMIRRFMVPTLQALFRIRYVNTRNEWRLRYLGFERLLTYRNGRFAFDCTEYLRRYLDRNGRGAELPKFIEDVGRVGIPGEVDPRCFMHGHDFVTMLRRMLNALHGRTVYRDDDEEVVASLLRTCADYRDLASEPLFAEIIRRLG